MTEKDPKLGLNTQPWTLPYAGPAKVRVLDTPKPTGYLAMAGDEVYAGIESDLSDCTQINNCIVIQFDSLEEMQAALRGMALSFTLRPKGLLQVSVDM